MSYLKSITVYYWSANHIALNISQTDHAYENDQFFAEYDEDSKLVHNDKFRALTHNSDSESRCTSNHTPEILKDLINTWFENKKQKVPSIIEDFWEDCSLYIRENQIELLKSLYQIMLVHQVFDDDEDLEDGYDEDPLPNKINILKQLGVDTTSGSEKRARSLVKAESHEALCPLIEQLQRDKTALEKKYLILDFVDLLRAQKGLGMDLGSGDEDHIYGKLPIIEWTLPVGNSLTLGDNDNDYLEHLNLFGLSVKGIENGIHKFENPESIVHHGAKETYYKFFSRYHNCSGYSRFLLEQGGITAFCSTNELEKFGVTDPSLYSAYMVKVQDKITTLNEQARDLMRNARIVPKPLDTIDINYLTLFKKGELKYDELPIAIRNNIDEYNNELVDVSYEYKIKLLSNLVNMLHSNGIKQPEIIDAIQKEIRRNYEIDFDAQFSHNQSFQLKCLEALATISVGALAVGILAIAFPPLIPITLAAAVITTTVATVSLALSIGVFAQKMQPQRPSAAPSDSTDRKNTMDESNERALPQPR
ncbi:MAG: hypothetical protein P4L79_02505 [Legionella sp.]|uniref:hypothetical protein n=1 Tax=Legionella sp. TaxID=459 RepID=UPI002846BA20|nr:hypothetical protein [Legionella sp.]